MEGETKNPKERGKCKEKEEKNRSTQKKQITDLKD